MISVDEFYNRLNASVSIYPGVKIGDAQNYNLVWNGKTIFFVHYEDSDKLVFNSNNLEVGEQEQVEIFFRNYLTNPNNVLY